MWQPRPGQRMLEPQTPVGQSPVAVVKVFIYLPRVDYQFRLRRVPAPLIFPRAEMHRYSLQHPLEHLCIALLRLPLKAVCEIPIVVILPPRWHLPGDRRRHLRPRHAPLLLRLVHKNEFAYLFIRQPPPKLCLRAQVVGNGNLPEPGIRHHFMPVVRPFREAAQEVPDLLVVRVEEMRSIGVQHHPALVLVETVPANYWRASNTVTSILESASSRAATLPDIPLPTIRTFIVPYHKSPSVSLRLTDAHYSGRQFPRFGVGDGCLPYLA